MSVFGAYSRYYNLLYRDKDYVGEAAYVRDLIQQHHPRARSLLDLGCGTGRHDLLLAEHGYSVTGVDLSDEMLEVARQQAQAARGALPTFLPGDVRSVRLGKTFDVVVSLFHVMSYQTSNSDLLAAFSTARDHLEPGGLFVFDCWYGPAVLSERPSVRIKRLEDEQILVTRLAEPVMHENENTVDVNYQIFIQQKSDHALTELRETHRMRYLFQPEVAAMLESCGLELRAAHEFQTQRPHGAHSWSVTFIAGHTPDTRRAPTA